MKILSFQPDSLYKNGGASRVLRRLYYGHEDKVSSLYVSLDGRKYNGKVNEVRIDAFPIHRQWMRWKARSFFSFLRESFFFKKTAAKVLSAAKNIHFDVLHVVNHGPYSSVLVEESDLEGKSLWVSFHDHYSLCSSFDQCKLLWELADRRLAISDELGQEYQRLFSYRPYELITDGVGETEVSLPKKEIGEKKLNVYFGGLLHIAYLPLLRVFADALDHFSKEGYDISLVLRGTQRVDFLKDRHFQIEYRGNFVSDDDIKTELDEADILYLPIKFSSPEFFKFSLSTKMIGYLGGAGVILFHGPFESAACQLLVKNDAAVICSTLESNDMISAINEVIGNGLEKSRNAKDLASNKFSLKGFQKQFWQANIN